MKTSVIDLGLTWSNPQLMQALTAAFNQTEPAQIIINTTGSTGLNKRVQLSSKALFISAKLSNEILGASNCDIWSLLLPTNHIAGLNVLARAITLDSEIVSVEGKAKFSAIVPTQLHRALSGDAQLLNHLQNCQAVLVGGSATSKELLESAKQHKINVVTTYGMTETSGGCVYNNVALPGVEVSTTEAGLLKIKGAVLADGYENQEQLWAANFSDGWFTTNDLGEVRDGKVFVTGRADDVIISGGENVSLIAVEKILLENFKGVKFLATSISDSEWGQKLCLLSDVAIDQNEISELLQGKLGKASVPKEFLAVSEIPTIGIGKPDRVKASQLFIDKQR